MHVHFSESYFEVDLVNRLQTVIEKQRSEIKNLDQAIMDYKAETEEVRTIYSLECRPDHQVTKDDYVSPELIQLIMIIMITFGSSSRVTMRR